MSYKDKCTCNDSSNHDERAKCRAHCKDTGPCVLEGEDAERLLQDLENCASPDEMELRRQAAKLAIEEMQRPKGFPKKPEGK